MDVELAFAATTSGLSGTRRDSSTWSQQLEACPGPTVTLGGAVVLQIAMAWGQRGWNRQPLGGVIRLGGAPLPARLGGSTRSGSGAAESSS
jgi:hypothetical protein